MEHRKQVRVSRTEVSHIANVLRQTPKVSTTPEHKRDWYTGRKSANLPRRCLLRQQAHLERTHLNKKTHRALHSLIRCSRSSWGLSFNHLATIYQHCLLPMITYASSVWYNHIRQKTQMDNLAKLQRQILIIMTKSYRSVSTEALTVIANVLPLELELRLKNDIWALNRGLRTSAVTPEILKAETPERKELEDIRIRVELSGSGGEGNFTIYTRMDPRRKRT